MTSFIYIYPYIDVSDIYYSVNLEDRETHTHTACLYVFACPLWFLSLLAVYSLPSSYSSLPLFLSNSCQCYHTWKQHAQIHSSIHARSRALRETWNSSTEEWCMTNDEGHSSLWYHRQSFDHQLSDQLNPLSPATRSSDRARDSVSAALQRNNETGDIIFSLHTPGEGNGWSKQGQR